MNWSCSSQVCAYRIWRSLFQSFASYASNKYIIPSNTDEQWKHLTQWKCPTTRVIVSDLSVLQPAMWLRALEDAVYRTTSLANLARFDNDIVQAWRHVYPILLCMILIAKKVNKLSLLSELNIWSAPQGIQCRLQFVSVGPCMWAEFWQPHSCCWNLLRFLLCQGSRPIQLASQQPWSELASFSSNHLHP